MRKTSQFLLLLMTCAAQAALAANAETPPSDALSDRPAVSSHDLRRWIEELDSDQFAVREGAQASLVEAGKEALAMVTQAARHGSLESTTRAVNILITWSESEDSSLAVSALEELSSMKHRPRESASAAELLADVRERSALDRIVSLGGRYQANVRRFVGINQFSQPLGFHILIGKDWQGGNKGLELLRSIPRTWEVSIYAAPLDDEALKPLLDLPNLQKVELFGTNFSPAAIAPLQARIPQVDIRSGAFLGIRGDGGMAARVSRVVSDSAAEKAGLQAGDVITHFAGEPVNDFTTLTQMIAKHEPGDTVTLTISRRREQHAVESLRLPVTFAQWSLTSQEALINQSVDGESVPETPAPELPNLERR